MFVGVPSKPVASFSPPLFAQMQLVVVFTQPLLRNLIRI